MTASTSGDGIVNPSGAPVLLVGLVFCIILRKNRQNNGQKKNYNDLQNNTRFEK
jgi:hypothetical protein